MPSPFPGMDPYLEEHEIWPTVHNFLITRLADDLNKRMPRGYFASIEERRFLVECTIPRLSRSMSAGLGANSSPPVMEADPALDIEFPPADFRESFVEIHLARKPGSLIAVLEVLSPTNKNPGEGRDLYLAKQEELLGSKTHFIEIDLLRSGRHTVAVPDDRVDEADWDYLVCLHKGGWQNKYRVWPVPIAKRLPRIGVPLAGADPDVVIDLQAMPDGKVKHIGIGVRQK